MNKVLAFLALLAFPALSYSQSLVLSHVTVIDATGAPAKSEMTVVITGGRIAEIGKSTSIPKDAQTVDATGKFLIPGLWDMHGHPHRTDDLSLFIANGVTGVRVMGGLPWYSETRTQIQSGKIIGPRMTISSRLLDGPDPSQPAAPRAGDEAGIGKEWAEVMAGGRPRSLFVANAEDAHQAILRAKQDGAEFMKIHDGLSREAYFALANDSKKQGFVFVGHVPVGVSPVEASDAGQKSIEHSMGILLACSTHEVELRKATEALASLPGPQRAAKMEAIQRETLETFSMQKASALAARFVRNHTWQCPTLTSRYSIRDRAERSAATLRYIPAGVRARWQRAADATPEPSAEERAFAKMLDQKLLDALALIHRVGVRFIAGTDVGGSYLVPGFSLHDELADLVGAGFTPMQALQSATLDAARFLGQEKEWGTIQKGKLADLVLLDANPLENIGNTRKIRAVVVNGRILDRKTLDTTLDQIQTADQK
jgi:imidazolonepropionase-like amidohydrolase